MDLDVAVIPIFDKGYPDQEEIQGTYALCVFFALPGPNAKAFS